MVVRMFVMVMTMSPVLAEFLQYLVDPAVPEAGDGGYKGPGHLRGCQVLG